MAEDETVEAPERSNRKERARGEEREVPVVDCDATRERKYKSTGYVVGSSAGSRPSLLFPSPGPRLSRAWRCVAEGRVDLAPSDATLALAHPPAHIPRGQT